MWRFASNLISGSLGSYNKSVKPSMAASDCSDDEASSCSSREEGLECPICWESFNIVENIPYVLWCGHTLCKNCVLGLQCAVVKFPTFPVRLPLFISCPWCQLLCFRLIWNGHLRFPRKNFFLLWMVESINNDGLKSLPPLHEDGGTKSSWGSTRISISNINNHSRRAPHAPRRQPGRSSVLAHQLRNCLNTESLHEWLRKSLAAFMHVAAKFPLVVVLLSVVLYVIPASVAILALCILITILFAVPSFLVLCFAYASLDWLMREIAR